MTARALDINSGPVSRRNSGSKACLLVLLMLLCSGIFPAIQGGKTVSTSDGATIVDMEFHKGGYNNTNSLSLPNNSVVFNAKFDLIGKKYREERGYELTNRTGLLACNLSNVSVGYDRAVLDSQPYMSPSSINDAFLGYRDPYGVAAGDLNGDGTGDMAASFSLAGKAGYFPSRSDGTLRSFVEAPGMLSSPMGIAVGDVSGDGLADLVVAESGAGRITVFTQNATTHRLDPGAQYASDTNPVDVVLGDFNADTITDVAACTGKGSLCYVDVYNQNTATHLLNASVRYQLGVGMGTVFSMAAGELSGDSLTDIVATVKGNTFHFLKQQVGGFAAAAGISLGPGISSGGIAVGDVNGTYSGNEVIVAQADATQQGFAIYYQLAGSLAKGQSMMWPTQIPNYGSFAVGAGDVTGDWKGDVVIALPGNGWNNLTVVPQSVNGDLGLPVAYPLGNDFRELWVGDADGDGKKDALVACLMPDRIAGLFQNGTGAFGTRKELFFDSVAAAAGDLNNDGRVDVAVAARFSSRVGVFFQGGAGFGNKVTFGPCDDVVALAIADVTGDNTPDLLALCRGNDTIAVFSQVLGVLQPPVYFATGSSPMAFAVGDVTGDGIAEVVVAHGNDQNLSVYKQGGGALTLQDNYTIGLGQTSVVLGDFNSDGRTDVAVSRYPADAVLVFNQTNAGKLAAPATYAVGKGPVALAAGDFDTDTKTDLVAASNEGQSITPLVQDSSGGLTKKADIALGARPTGAFAGCVNNDGRAEIFIPSDSGNISVFRQDNSGGLKAPFNITVERGPPAMTLADLNKDGRTDMPVASASGTFYSYMQLDFLGGDGKSYALDNNPTMVSAGDLNNDGAKDIVVGYDNQISVLLQNQGGDLRQRVNYVTNSWNLRGLATGDLNGDGRDDVLVAGHDQAQVLVFYQNNQGTLDPYISIPFSNVLTHGGLACADVTGDGRKDIVLVDNHMSRVVIAPQNALGGLDSIVPYSTNSMPAGLAVGDVNSDGRSDVVVAGQATNAISVLTQKNDGTLNAMVSYTTSNGGNWGNEATEIADVNNDGRNDVLTFCTPANVVDVFTQKNDGTLNDKVSYTMYGNDNVGSGLAVADIDLDGKNETVVTNSNQANMTVLAQDSQGNLYQRDNFVTGSNPRWVVIADLNLDGAKDIACCNGGSANLSVFYMMARRGNITIPPITTPAQGMIESALVSWNQTAAAPGTTMSVWLSANGSVWVEVKNNTRVTYPQTTKSLQCRVDMLSSSTFSPALLSLQIRYNYSAYPSDPSFDIGDDGIVEWNRVGRFIGKETFTGPWLVTAFNDYLDTHRTSGGPNVTIPVNITSSTEGQITLTNISLDYNQPPSLLNDLPADLSIDEDTANPELLELRPLFMDDYTDTADLVFTLLGYTNDTIVKVVVMEDTTWLSVDAATGPGNDNWTGETAVSIEVTDGAGLSLYPDPIIVTIASVNDPPLVTSTPNSTTATVGFPWSYQMTGYDVENSTLRYVLDKGLPGMEMNTSSGRLTWVPKKEHVDLPDKRVSVRVYDGQLYSANQEFKLTVLPNLAPVITSSPPVSVYAGDDYIYQVNASDPENQTLSFALVQKPGGMSINETNGTVMWVPAPEQVGPNSVQVLVTDGLNPAIQNFQVEVLVRPIVNRAPVILNNPPLNATANQTYRHIVLARDDDNDRLTFSLESKPFGMTIDNPTGLITWTPGPWQIGNNIVVIRVTDGKLTAFQNFTITVDNDWVPPPPKPKPPVKPVDNTMLYAGIGMAVILGVVVAAMLFATTRRKKGVSARDLTVAADVPQRPAAPERGAAYRPSSPERGAGGATKKHAVVKPEEPYEPSKPERGPEMATVPPPEPADPKAIPPPETDVGDTEPETVSMEGTPQEPNVPKGDPSRKREMDDVFAKLTSDKSVAHPKRKKQEAVDIDKTVAEILEFKP